jgi:hypothetical protein
LVDLHQRVTADRVTAKELLESDATSNYRLFELECLMKEKNDLYAALEMQSAAKEEARDELLIGKQIADNRIQELISQMASDKIQSDELVKENKVISDSYKSELNSRLAEEVASLILKEQSISLQESLDKMESKVTELLNHNSVLERQITENKAEVNELAFSLTLNLLADKEARSLILKEQLTCHETLEMIGSDYTDSFDRLIASESQITTDERDQNQLAETMVTPYMSNNMPPPLQPETEPHPQIPIIQPQTPTSNRTLTPKYQPRRSSTTRGKCVEICLNLIAHM